MKSDYTPLGGSKLEKYIESNPDFKKSVRKEESAAKEGFFVLTDGSYSFGYVSVNDFKCVLDRRIEQHELSNRPSVLDHVNCDAIERNTRRYEKTSRQTALSKCADAIDSKVSKVVPKMKIIVLVIFLVLAAIGAPYLSSKIFSTPSAGYSDDFYQSGRASGKLKRLHGKWQRSHENEKIIDEKLATYAVSEILKFSEEVDRERLTDVQKEALDHLLEKVGEGEK